MTTPSKRKSRAAKILPFPVLADLPMENDALMQGPARAAEIDGAPGSLFAAARLAYADQRADALDTGTPLARLTSVRRRRALQPEEEGEAAEAECPAAQPTVEQLITWLLNLRQGGVGSIYWNAAKIQLDVAITRATRLGDDAQIEVSGQRLFVVETLQRRPCRKASPAKSSAREALEALESAPVDAGPGMVVP